MDSSDQNSCDDSDSALLRRYLGGDHGALASLCVRYAQPLNRIVSSYLDPLVARRVSESDLVQETWMVAVKKLKNKPETPEIALFPWLDCTLACYRRAPDASWS
ncbi:RNA polymerase sigma factor [Aureliella helgolandensis]|uniref:RNA polymerase sigma factor n=1 Tax=Aureliella helgolandensis TaxID=2527968 RepID=A0A518G1Y0_9BACT|nr:RNA polymerase sigma factor [Aureliella helgolandensis]